MIAAGLDWGNDSRFDLSRIAPSLGLLSGRVAECEEHGRGILASLPAPRSAPSLRPNRARGPQTWQAARSPAGTPVLLAGWIDNAAQIAAELGLYPADTAAAIYGAAVEAWGNDAERKLIGEYTAIMVPGPAVMRLARAPWSQFPLFWAAEGSVAIAASIPRPIFAAGFPKQGDPDLYAAALYGLGALEGEGHFFTGLHRVPQGSIVMLDHGRPETGRWYDPHALSPIRLRRDDDYVDAANALLSEAVSAALRPARRPAILLSGGLDSPLVAAEMLRQMPEGQRLKSFTFEPLPGDHGDDEPGTFQSDRPAVEAFAAMHPRIEPHFVDNAGTDFRTRLQDQFLAADAAYPIMTAIEMDGPRQAAADAGCDWLFTGDMGNQTISNDGRWAFVEFLHRGKWIELWRMLRETPGDERSMIRRLAARSLLPNLPAAIRSALRTMVHGPPGESLIRKDVVERLQLDDRRKDVFGDREWPASRHAMIEVAWQQNAGGGEIAYAVEQIHGIRVRAVPQYRPLLEFCLSIPTDQFVRGGQMRWLARRMAKGRLPEAQRLDTRYGRHGVDWHQRYTPQVPAMREELERICDDPVMTQIIDVDRAIDLLEQWPDHPGARGQAEVFMPIAAAIIAGRFSRYVDGRN